MTTKKKKINNEWEKEFLNNQYSNPSPKQAACLLKIYEKATGGGDYQRRQYI
jgi:hypothetical protein